MSIYEEKKNKAMCLRYKTPALSDIGFEAILTGLSEIEDCCCEVQYSLEDSPESIMDAFNGDTEEFNDFQMAFSDLEAKCEQLHEAIQDFRCYDPEITKDQHFDDCTVALIGNRYNLVGYDDYEEDYFHLSSYEAGLAQTEAGKRLMRLKKEDLIAEIGQAMGITVAYIDLKTAYDKLSTTLDIFKGENNSLSKQLRQIDEAYKKASEEDFIDGYPSVCTFNNLVAQLPPVVWLN